MRRYIPSECPQVYMFPSYTHFTLPDLGGPQRFRQRTFRSLTLKYKADVVRNVSRVKKPHQVNVPLMLRLNNCREVFITIRLLSNTVNPCKLKCTNLSNTSHARNTNNDEIPGPKRKQQNHYRVHKSLPLECKPLCMKSTVS